MDFSLARCRVWTVYHWPGYEEYPYKQRVYGCSQCAENMEVYTWYSPEIEIVVVMDIYKNKINPVICKCRN